MLNGFVWLPTAQGKPEQSKNVIEAEREREQVKTETASLCSQSGTGQVKNH